MCECMSVMYWKKAKAVDDYGYAGSDTLPRLQHSKVVKLLSLRTPYKKDKSKSNL